jgi:hypothetical protein
MKSKVEFKNYLRSLDALESDVVDAERQGQVAKRLADLARPMRQRILNDLERHIVNGKINLPRRQD